MAEETPMAYAKVSPEGQVISVSESDVQPQLTQPEAAQGYSVQEVPQGTKAGDVVEVDEANQREGGGPAFSGQESPQERASRNLQGSQGPEVLRPDKQQPTPTQQPSARGSQDRTRGGKEADEERERKEREQRDQKQREQQEREKKEREQREQKEREQAKAKQR